MAYSGFFAFALVVVIAFGRSDATHFRGGTISWEHLGSANDVDEVLFSFRLGWRRDSTSEMCDAGTVENQTALHPRGSWTLSGPATGTDFPHSVAIICTSYDLGENWAYGFNSFKSNVTTFGNFNVRFAGGNWLSSLAFGSDASWSVAVLDIDFSIRSDTGEVNHPPFTLNAPVIRMQLGCPETIHISGVDKDDDRISCRYAVGNLECGGVCGDYSSFYLNETSCTIYYNGGGAAVTVPVALMLEDHPRKTVTLGGNRTVNPTDTLSSIPLQFLVSIKSTSGCNVIPTYPGQESTVTSNSVITIAESGFLNETLAAYPSDLSLTITQFVVIGPVGLTTSDILSLSSGLYKVYITWYPHTSQSGDNLVCYYAVDSAGKNGAQICFTVSVEAIASPCEVNNGGCNDVCVPLGSSYSCECKRSCWFLAEDAKTCSPNMDVICDGNGVEISVPKCASSKTVVAGTKLEEFAQSSCQSNETSRSHLLNLSLSDCGLQIRSIPTHLIYTLNLWFWESFENDSSIITRGEWRNTPVTCSLPRVGLLLNSSFVPIPPLVDEFFPDEIEIEGMGQFSLYFEFYRTDAFMVSFSPSDYPIQLNVNDEMFFALGAYGRGGLTVFTEQCVAMSGRSIETSFLIYPFIEDGCLVDSTIVRHNDSNPMRNKFSMRVFEFQDRLLASREDAEISIQCEILLCDTTISGTRCAQGCSSGSGRTKRSIENDDTRMTVRSRIRRQEEDGDDDSLAPPTIAESPLQAVGSRFILIVDSSESDESDPNNSISVTNGILIGLCILAVVIISFIAYGVVKYRGRKMRDYPAKA